MLNSEVHAIVSDDLLVMRDFISQNVKACNKLAKEVILHLVLSGGKKIRPKLVFIICKMLNYNEKKRINIAAAVEFIHNATLLHDDVLDESKVRHGVDTTNKIWGNKISILVGDLLLTLAFRWLIECQNLSILSTLSEASNSLVSGEIKQMTTSFNPIEMRGNYFYIIENKTASLFSACCTAASIVSGATLDETEKLKIFGLNFGIAFQIIDDTLDYIADQRSSGKKRGKDLFDGRATLPAIIAYEKGNLEEQEFWKRCFTIKNSQDLDRALSYIEKHNAIQLATKEAQYYASIAQNSISAFSNSPYKATLIDLLNTSIRRPYLL